MIKTIEQIQEQLNRVREIIDAISFRESVHLKDYKLLRKVCQSLCKLSYTVITDKLGMIIF